MHIVASPAISIHAPRVGSDFFSFTPSTSKVYFNPRSPCGERHVEWDYCVPKILFQSTLPVWGATDGREYSRDEGRISIHAPRVGSDVWNSLRGNHCRISIHAPRVGSDKLAGPQIRQEQNFNPRSPCGERRKAPTKSTWSTSFQSTLPVWGATALVAVYP